MPSALDIADLASALLERAKARPVEKTAAEEPALPELPAVVELRKLAATLRETPDHTVVTIERLAKIAAAQPSTGAQSPGQGAGAGAMSAPPTLPSLQTTNLGVTAGAGGAPATLKTAALLRQLASTVRAEEQAGVEETTKTAHAVLRGAVGLHYLRQDLT